MSDSTGSIGSTGPVSPVAAAAAAASTGTPAPGAQASGASRISSLEDLKKLPDGEKLYNQTLIAIATPMISEMKRRQERIREIFREARERDNA